MRTVEQRAAHSAYMSEWQRKNPRKYANSQMLIRNGMTLVEYEKMVADQGGVCAICGCDNGDRRLCIDHNHETGRRRKLLCDKCNRGLGLFQDSAIILAAALAYLEDH